MITEKDLQEAIAECQGVRNPNASTCIKLAAFYIIQEHLYGKPTESETAPAYSFAAEPANSPETYIDYYGDSEFAQVIDGKEAVEVWRIMDELISVIQATNNRLYEGVLRKIKDL